MGFIIGSARIDERGRASGGIAGDQKQAGAPDRRGEVSLQDFYIPLKGWYILRAKKPETAAALAVSMERACNNPNIGYDQGSRLEVLKHGTASKVKTEADCSSLVRLCIIEAAGKDPGNFTTANEAQAILGTGLFVRLAFTGADRLWIGDILVTKSKGHTVIVTGMNRGATGGCVQELQTLLNYASIQPRLMVDGVYGPLTMNNLVAWQKIHGMRGTGAVDALTWEKLQK